LVVGTIFSCLFPDNRQPLPAPVAQDQLAEPVVEETGKEDEPVTMDGTIVMYTSHNCVWCSKWKASELAKIKAAGWKFEETYTADGPWPRFDIYGRGKVVRHVGYMSMSALKQIVEEM
jgi:hypothetical protein